MNRLVLLMMFLCAWLVGSHANAADDMSCRNGGFPSEQSTFGQGKVIGSGHLDLLSDMDGCPSSTKKCNGFGYVLPGDVVITGRSDGAYVCAFYPNRVGGSAGWVEKSRLSLMPVDTKPALKDWAGAWKDGDNELHVSLSRGQLHVKGDAYWPSANPSQQDAPGGPNIGSVDASAQPDGNKLQLAEGSDTYSCKVTATLLGTRLIVDDNNNCGGMNVTFRGVYQRH